LDQRYGRKERDKDPQGEPGRQRLLAESAKTGILAGLGHEARRINQGPQRRAALETDPCGLMRHWQGRFEGPHFDRQQAFGPLAKTHEKAFSRTKLAQAIAAQRLHVNENVLSALSLG